jgi:hypothetical protein
VPVPLDSWSPMKPGDLRKWTSDHIPDFIRTDDILMVIDVDPQEVDHIRRVTFMVNGTVESMSLGWIRLSSEVIDEAG